jgi:hypothetical protein
MLLIIILSVVYLIGAAISFKYFNSKILFVIFWPVDLAIVILLLVLGVLGGPLIAAYYNLREAYYERKERKKHERMR